MLIHGTYHFSRKLVAYRYDYCMNCENPRVAGQWRTFDVLHLCFVPLIPLGFWKRWACSACGKPPHARVKTSRGVKILGAVISLVWSGISFYCAIFTSPKSGEDNSGLWTMGALGIAAFAYLCYSLSQKETPAPDLNEQLGRLQTPTEMSCPFCGGRLQSGLTTFCEGCGVQRLNSVKKARTS